MSVTSDVSQRIFSKVSTESVRSSSQSRRVSFIGATSCRTSASSPARARRDMRSARPAGSSTSGRPPLRRRSTSASSARDWAAVSSQSRPRRLRPADRTSAAAAPRCRHRREHRPPGGEVLVHLARDDRVAAPVGVRDQEQQGVGRALRGDGLPERHEPGLLPRVVDAESPAPRRDRTRAGRRRSARAPGRAGRAGGRAGRARRSGTGAGVRWPKNAPVCTIVNGPAGCVAQTVEVAQVDAVADHVRLCRCARIELAAAPRRSRR